jgi:hypothetical protein
VPTITLLELRERVRDAADMADTDFVSDEELNRHINNALWALDDKLHRTWEDYYSEELSTTVTGNTHPLGVNFYKLVGIEVRQGGTGDWVQLKPYSHAERSLYRNLNTTRPEENRYRIRGTGVLHFLPGFSAATPAIITYYSQRTALEDDADDVEYPGGWEEWAVLKAAINCMAKEERDTAALEKLFALEDQRVSDVESGDSGAGIARWRR